MGKTGKVITIIIIAFLGLIALMIIKEARGGGMVFFGLFGIALYLVYQNLFKKKDLGDNSNIEKVEDDEIKLKK